VLVPVKKVSFVAGRTDSSKNLETYSEPGSNESPKEESKESLVKRVKMINFKKLDEDFEIPEDW